jgi:hypothetical protein
MTNPRAYVVKRFDPVLKTFAFHISLVAQYTIHCLQNPPTFSLQKDEILHPERSFVGMDSGVHCQLLVDNPIEVIAPIIIKVKL